MVRWVARAFWALVLVAAYLIAPTAARADDDARLPIDPGMSTTELVYGWHWAGQVQVYDASPAAARWDVKGAVREWGLHNGIDLVMTDDPAQAEITFVEVATTGCSLSAIGCAHLPPVSGDVAYGNCLAEGKAAYGYEGVSQEISEHEIGHCLGLDHADTTRSVMYYATSRYDYLTRPTAYDYRDMRTLYGR